jgi:uncharacterized membrane protein YhaH (DUF805 family)
MIIHQEITGQTTLPQNKHCIKIPISDLLSTKGRIGRFSYFFYTLFLPVLIFWVFAAIAGLLGKMGQTGETIGYGVLFLAFLASLFSLFQLAIKRCHDFNAHGGLSLLILVPFAFLLLCLIPGNHHDNSYGEPPDKPSTLLKTGSLLLIAAIVAFTSYTALKALMG